MRIEQVLFEFKGRVHRWPFLGLSILNTVISGSLLVLGVLLMERGKHIQNLPLEIFGVFTVFFMFCIFMWVGLALQVKRLHDMNLSGYYVLGFIFISGLCSVMNIALPGVEIVGTAINVLFGCILLFTPGTQGPNKFDGDSFKDQRSNRTAYQ
ncbi:MAG: DUF805 domain-containing protein [Acidocella sp.]|nr:DUF805 domain-containing protein [Acidocella sp.]